MDKPRTRRRFLADSARAGLAAAALTTVGGRAISHAQPSEMESIQVLIGEVVHEAAEIAAYSTTGPAQDWRESPPVETAFPFTHVGLHWQGDPLERLQIRTSVEGTLWSPWTPLTVESRPAENPREEWFAALVGAHRARFVQYRLPAAEPTPPRLTLTYLNSLDGPRRPLGQSPISPSLPTKGSDFRTRLITREEWGADESLRFSASGAEEWARAYVAPRIVVVHHTATRNLSPDPAADVRAIYAFHAITQGFGDIGYHALVDPEGNIYEGRRGRDLDPYGLLPRDVLSYGVVGGHALGYNYGSSSIALLGNFQDGPPTAAAWQALEELLVFQHRRYEIDPRTTLDFARSNDLWRYDLPTLPGHRDCTPTECPGDYVFPLLPALRDRVAERIAGHRPSYHAITQAPRGRNHWLGSASYAWQGSPPYDCVFEGFWKIPGEDPVEYRTGYDSLAMPQHVVTSQPGASFRVPEPGHYTLHLRPHDQPFADRMTILVDRHLVRDNADSEGVHRTEGWTHSRAVQEYYGSDYEVAPAGSHAELTWELSVPESGQYRVQACWASGPDRSRAAPYTIARDGVPLETVTIDQSRGGAAWATVGTFDFAEGQTCQVTLSAPEAAAEQVVVVADAIRLVLVG